MELAAAFRNATGQRYVWTTHPWLVKHFLRCGAFPHLPGEAVRCPTPARAARFEARPRG